MLARDWPAIVLALVFAMVGPWLTLPRSSPAGEPFAYVPPPGVVENLGQSLGPVDMRASTKPLTRPPPGEREWIGAPTSAVPGASPDVRITLAHSASKGTVEAADLARISDGMPAMLAPEGVTWKPVRQETRHRPDGSRVGLVEGACQKGDLSYRRLMLAFPDDTGLSVVVAVYGEDGIARWQPAIEATIDTARGVEKRVPSPPPWVRLAWGGGGLVVGMLGLRLARRRRPSAAT